MFNKILIPLDGSELAERALEPGLALARLSEAEVWLLRVAAPEQMLVPDPQVFGGYGVVWPDQALARERAAATEYLKVICDTRVPPELNARTQVVEDGVAEAIVDTAATEKVDLIAMSSHGYSGVTRWMLGSVAEKVLHSAPCPVLVIRSPRPIQHILIPLDGSALSELAVGPGFDLAVGLGAEVTLLRAIQPVDVAEVQRLDKLERGLGRRLEEEVHEEVGDYLRGVIAAHPRPGLAINIAVTFEPAATRILQYAETHGVDVIVMSTHGRTGLARWVYGSVAEKVLRGGQHSMLVVRPPQYRLSQQPFQGRP
jgi:nucleotide-binding universal stress UspA family protein